MLQVNEEALTRGQLRAATQKVALGNAYLRIMGEDSLSQAIQQDLEGAEQALLDGNQAGALELAELINGEVGAEMQSVEASRIAGERARRLMVAAIVLLVALLFFWARRGPNTLVSITAGVTAVATSYALYRVKGYTFSLTTVDSIDVFVVMLVSLAGIGLIAGGLLLLAGLLYQDQRLWSTAITAGYDYGLFAVFLSALPALYGFWQHGASVRWYLPDLNLILLHFSSLVQVSIAAILAIPLPWIIALLVWGVGRWRTYSETRAKAWDPIARQRRR
jgi:hypothetical protein